MGSSSLRQDRLLIRPCELEDMAAVHAIYEEQVLRGSASFEEIAPSVDTLTERREAIASIGFPYLVAVIDGAVVGYAYAGRYRTRSAYRHTAENSVYVHERFRGCGVGKALLLDIIKACERIGLRELVGIVGDSGNVGSVRLHESCGFEIVGTLKNVGYKHERWLDTVILQKTLTPLDSKPLPPLVN